MAEIVAADAPFVRTEMSRADALAKLRDRHLLCVGTWDCDTIDIYLSNADAQWLFNWASVGTKVVTHY